MSTIKIVFNSEIRRCKVNPSAHPFQELARIVHDSYGFDVFEVRYHDDENDLCLITSEDEMKEALRMATGGKTLKLFLSEPKSKPAGSEQTKELKQPSSDPISESTSSASLVSEPSEPSEPSIAPTSEPIAIEPAEPIAPISEPVAIDPISEPVVIDPISEPVVIDPISEPVVIDPISEPVVIDPISEPVVSAPNSEPASSPSLPEPEVSPSLAVEPVLEDIPVSDQKTGKPRLHEKARCEICGISPIEGIRYKCTVCEECDLCQLCEAKNEHPLDHVLLKVKVPLSTSFKFVSPFPKWVFADQGRELRPRANFVRDVTVPDGSAWRPGQRVLKTWAMKNNGESFWPRDTKLIFVSGHLKPAEEEQPLIPLAAPGESVDISVQLKMPDKPGRYTGYYRLAYGNGDQVVGFGDRIWLDVLVSESALPDVKGVFDKAFEAVAKVFKGEKPKESKQPEAEIPKAEKEKEVAFAFENELLQLKGMGFSDEKRIKELLIKYNGDVQRATNQLL